MRDVYAHARTSDRSSGRGGSRVDRGLEDYRDEICVHVHAWIIHSALRARSSQHTRVRTRARHSALADISLLARASSLLILLLLLLLSPSSSRRRRLFSRLRTLLSCSRPIHAATAPNNSRVRTIKVPFFTITKTKTL